MTLYEFRASNHEKSYITTCFPRVFCWNIAVEDDWVLIGKFCKKSTQHIASNIEDNLTTDRVFETCMFEE